MTNLQVEFMNLIARCEMNQVNGAVPESAQDVHTYTWADERAAMLGITKKELGAVMSSLIAKGYIGCTSWMGDDNGVWFTEAGFAAWNADVRADKS